MMKNNFMNLKKTDWAMMLVLVASFFLVVYSCGESDTPKTDEELGKDLYVAYCELCHGKNGDGAMAEMLKIPPPDLTQISVRRNGEFPEDEIYKIIDGQEALENGHGNRTMPIWGEVFGTTENVDEVMVPKKIYQLIAYLKSIQK